MLLSLTTVFTFRLLEPNLFLVSLNQMGAPMLAAVPVSYTHLTLPTILLV